MNASRPVHPLTGRRFRIHAPSAKALAAYLHRLDTLRTELRLGMRSPDRVDRDLRFLQHGPVTLERAAVGYMRRGRIAPSTREAVASMLRDHLAALRGLSLYDLDKRRIERWIDERARAGLQESTIDKLWRRLRAIVGYACARGWIGALPWGTYRPKLSRRGRVREAARDVHELSRILFSARDLDCRAWVDGRDAGDREAKIACVALLGVRQGELAGLRWSDVDAPTGGAVRVRIARQWDGQPLKRGTFPVTLEAIPELGPILEAYAERLEELGLYDPRGPVFPWPKGSRRGAPVPYRKGEPLSRRNVRAAVRLAGLSDLQAWSAHSLRDTFVTLESRATGGDLARVAARSRHASLAALARYLRSFDRQHPSAPAIGSLPGRDRGAPGAPPRTIPHALLLSPAKETPP